LGSLNPGAVLERGYSLTRNALGEVVLDAARVKEGERLTTTLAKGWVESEVRKKGR
jgi:exodeoxyribonuclease VII large subunit